MVAEKRRFDIGRIDFQMKILGEKRADDGSTCLSVALIPDSSRYETIEKDGKTVWKDRFTGICFGEEILASLANQMKDTPLYWNPPKGTDIVAFLRSQRDDIVAHWDERYEMNGPLRPLEEILAGLIGQKTRVVILYVDMEGSTIISQQLDIDDNAKITKLFLMEVAKIVDYYKGYVLKPVGDQIIGIFPADCNYTGMCDSAIQACMMIRSLVLDVLNPIFADRDLPEIGFHIGLDIGEVKVDTVGAKDIGSFLDLIGYPMNLTAKIQARSGHNGVMLGRNLYEVLHCNWQQYCEKEVMDEKWTMLDLQRGGAYEVFRFNGKWNYSSLDESSSNTDNPS